MCLNTIEALAMKTFRDLAQGKLSVVLRAMVDGIDQYPDEGFRLTMETFGMVSVSGICYGCAATAAMAKLSGLKEIRFSKRIAFGNTAQTLGKYSLAQYFAADPDDLSEFENAVDCLRTGDVNTICEYLDFNSNEADEFIDKWKNRWCIRDDSPLNDHRVAIEECVSWLEERGL
jgi:hypothetical protein